MDYLPDDILFTIFVYLDIDDLIKIPEFKLRISHNWSLLFRLKFTQVDINQVELIDYSYPDFDYFYLIYKKLANTYDYVIGEFFRMIKVKQKLLEILKNSGYTNEEKSEIMFDDLSVESGSWTFIIRSFNNIKLYLNLLKTYEYLFTLFLSKGPEGPYISDVMHVTIFGDQIKIMFEIYDNNKEIYVKSDFISVSLKQGLEILIHGINISKHTKLIV